MKVGGYLFPDGEGTGDGLRIDHERDGAGLGIRGNGQNKAGVGDDRRTGFGLAEKDQGRGLPAEKAGPEDEDCSPLDASRGLNRRDDGFLGEVLRHRHSPMITGSSYLNLRYPSSSPSSRPLACESPRSNVGCPWDRGATVHPVSLLRGRADDREVGKKGTYEAL